MSEHACETVRIVAKKTEDNPLGFIVINKEDFNEETHELFVESAPTKAELKALEAEAKRMLKEQQDAEAAALALKAAEAQAGAPGATAPSFLQNK